MEDVTTFHNNEQKEVEIVTKKTKTNKLNPY
jgi:hypothetical protein